MSKKVVKRNWTVKGESDHLVQLPLTDPELHQRPGGPEAGEGPAARGNQPQKNPHQATPALREQALADLEQELKHRREEHERQIETATRQHEQKLAEHRSALERDLRRELENEFRQRYEQAIKSLEKAADSLGQDRDAYLAQVELPALELVLEISRQLLGKEIREDSSVLTGLIVKAFKMLKPQEIVTVKVHPATFHLLLENEGFNAALSQAGFSPTLVELDIDDSLETDQFKAELGGMRIEFDLSEAVSRIFNLLSEELQATLPPVATAND